MFNLSSYWPINQSYVTVMLNKRPYTNNIAVFDMFTVILPNTFNFFQDHDAYGVRTKEECLFCFCECSKHRLKGFCNTNVLIRLLSPTLLATS